MSEHASLAQEKQPGTALSVAGHVRKLPMWPKLKLLLFCVACGLAPVGVWAQASATPRPRESSGEACVQSVFENVGTRTRILERHASERHLVGSAASQRRLRSLRRWGTLLVQRSGRKRLFDHNIFLAAVFEGRVRHKQYGRLGPLFHGALFVDIGSAILYGEGAPTVRDLNDDPSVMPFLSGLVATDINDPSSELTRFVDIYRNQTKQLPFPVEEIDLRLIWPAQIEQIIRSHVSRPSTPLIFRSSNSGPDLFYSADHVEAHLDAVAQSSVGRSVLYLFNVFVLFKPPFENRFQILGRVDEKVGLWHGQPVWDQIDWTKRKLTEAFLPEQSHVELVPPGTDAVAPNLVRRKAEPGPAAESTVAVRSLHGALGFLLGALLVLLLLRLRRARATREPTPVAADSRPLRAEQAAGELFPLDSLLRRPLRGDQPMRGVRVESLPAAGAWHHTISLQGLSYVAFLQASLPSPDGGGLRAASPAVGSIFRIFVHEGHTIARAAARPPEIWLQDCFLRLREFLSAVVPPADASVTLGLIDQKSGLLYALGPAHMRDAEGKPASQVAVPIATISAAGPVAGDLANLRVHVIRARAAFAAVADHQNGQSPLRLAFRRDLSLVPEAPDPTYRGLLAQANSLLKAKNLRAAAPLLAQAARIRPTEKILRVLIRYRLQGKDYRQALSDTMRLLELTPEKTEVLFAISWLLSRLPGRLREAAEFGERCRLRDPSMAQNNGNLERIQLRLASG